MPRAASSRPTCTARQLELHCQVLVDPDQSQSLVVYTATPGSESYEKLRLLSVVAGQGI